MPNAVERLTAILKARVQLTPVLICVTYTLLETYTWSEKCYKYKSQYFPLILQYKTSPYIPLFEVVC